MRHGSTSEYPARILGWDTSAKLGYLFASEVRSSSEPAVIYQAQVLDVDQKQHSEGLLLGISDALEACSWKISELSAIGVGVGPGSFTGIRIGLTTARTLGQIQGVPLIPVSSLELLETAWRRSSKVDEAPVLVCADACMGEIYCRMSSPGRGGASELVTKITLVEEHLGRWCEGMDREASLHAILPESWKSHPVLSAIFSTGRWKVVSTSSLAGIPEALSRLVLREWSRGATVRALDAHPVYLRVSDAELHLRARENALRNPVGGG
jgi:tRNA threonylcarbamoyl adenosine modification protein YeaZ